MQHAKQELEIGEKITKGASAAPNPKVEKGGGVEAGGPPVEASPVGESRGKSSRRTSIGARLSHGGRAGGDSGSRQGLHSSTF